MFLPSANVEKINKIYKFELGSYLKKLNIFFFIWGFNNNYKLVRV